MKIITFKSILLSISTFATIAISAQNNTIIVTSTSEDVQVESVQTINGKADTGEDVHSYLDDIGLKTKYKVDGDGSIKNTDQDDITKSQNQSANKVDAKGGILEDKTTITSSMKYENGSYVTSVTIENKNDDSKPIISVDNGHKTDTTTMKYWVDDQGNRHDIMAGDQVIILTRK